MGGKRHSSGPFLTIKLKRNCSLVTSYQLQAWGLTCLIRGFSEQRGSSVLSLDWLVWKGRLESSIDSVWRLDWPCFDNCATCCEVIVCTIMMMSGACAQSFPLVNQGFGVGGGRGGGRGVFLHYNSKSSDANWEISWCYPMCMLKPYNRLLLGSSVIFSQHLKDSTISLVAVRI